MRTWVRESSSPGCGHRRALMSMVRAWWLLKECGISLVAELLTASQGEPFVTRCARHSNTCIHISICVWGVVFNPLQPRGHYMYHQFNIQQFFLPTQCIYVFCVDLRTNSDYFTVQPWLVGFYKRRSGVYCAVRTESLNIIEFKFSFQRVN